MPDEEPASTGEDPKDIFSQVFGVSEDELRRKGIDPAEYVQKNVGKAVRNEKRMAPVWANALPSERARNESLIWGERAMYLMVATGLTLLLSIVVPEPLRSVLIAIAVLVFCAVGVAVVRYYSLILRWRRLKRSGE